VHSTCWYIQFYMFHTIYHPWTLACQAVILWKTIIHETGQNTLNVYGTSRNITFITFPTPLQELQTDVNGYIVTCINQYVMSKLQSRWMYHMYLQVLTLPKPLHEGQTYIFAFGKWPLPPNSKTKSVLMRKERGYGLNQDDHYYMYKNDGSFAKKTLVLIN